MRSLCIEGLVWFVHTYPIFASPYRNEVFFWNSVIQRCWVYRFFRSANRSRRSIKDDGKSATNFVRAGRQQKGGSPPSHDCTKQEEWRCFQEGKEKSGIVCPHWWQFQLLPNPTSGEIIYKGLCIIGLGKTGVSRCFDRQGELWSNDRELDGQVLDVLLQQGSPLSI